MVYLCGVNFALRSGQEQRSLLKSQIQIKTAENDDSYLIYTENFSKNNPGGLAHRKIIPKTVTHHLNAENPKRCFVTLYQKYLSHCPSSSDITALYLTPLKKPKDNVWYGKIPVGHNTLSQTVRYLCNTAGIPGYKTNHSLRVTSATRLFQGGMDEQLIMSRTGHRSIEGIRSYKRVSEDQRVVLSDILNSATNGTTNGTTNDTKRPKLSPTVNSAQPNIFNFSNCNINFNL